MKNNFNFKIEKTGYNFRTRKNRDILAVILDANDEVIDAIAPCGNGGNHRATLEWAEWRAESIIDEYPAAVRIKVYCGNDEIAIITFAQTPSLEPQNACEALNFCANMREVIENAAPRSAWDRGVQAYALELLDNYNEYVQQATNQGQAVPELSEVTLLNGAADWLQYSCGGSSLIYDADIAERLCSPSELKRCKGGERNPNNHEQWLDIQARALYQAELSLSLTVGNVSHYGKSAVYANAAHK